MRSKEEILRETGRKMMVPADRNIIILDSILKVLLDIRELLYDEQNKPY